MANTKTMKTRRFLSTLLFVITTTSVEPFSLPPCRKPPPTRANSCSASALSLQTEPMAAGVLLVGGGALVVWLSGTKDRAQKAKYAEWEAKDAAMRAERAKRAYIEPREYWKEEDLRPYDGTRDEDGPILIAVDGVVYNVWKGRHFYGPGAEYRIFAGRDATRLLAKFITEEESEESKQKPLSMAERATLAGYIYTFKEKYDAVGKLEGHNPKDTAMW